MENNDVKNFYNKFARANLLSDFFYFNKRQDEVKKLCKNFILPKSIILEIGCGTGVITKYLIKTAGKIVAIDISDKNVEICKHYVKSKKVNFLVLDILSQEKKYFENTKFDIILLADVLEHLPKNNHLSVFKLIESYLSENGKVIITYPSPEYQRFLKINSPNALQIIDEEIELQEILSKTKLKLISFNYKNIWNNNEYIHLVLQKNVSLNNIKKRHINNFLLYRLKKYSWRIRHIFFYQKIKKIIN